MQVVLHKLLSSQQDFSLPSRMQVISLAIQIRGKELTNLDLLTLLSDLRYNEVVSLYVGHFLAFLLVKPLPHVVVVLLLLRVVSGQVENHLILLPETVFNLLLEQSLQSNRRAHLVGYSIKSLKEHLSLLHDLPFDCRDTLKSSDFGESQLRHVGHHEVIFRVDLVLVVLQVDLLVDLLRNHIHRLLAAPASLLVLHIRSP